MKTYVSGTGDYHFSATNLTAYETLVHYHEGVLSNLQQSLIHSTRQVTEL